MGHGRHFPAGGQGKHWVSLRRIPVSGRQHPWLPAPGCLGCPPAPPCGHGQRFPPSPRPGPPVSTGPERWLCSVPALHHKALRVQTQPCKQPDLGSALPMLQQGSGTLLVPVRAAAAVTAAGRPHRVHCRLRGWAEQRVMVLGGFSCTTRLCSHVGSQNPRAVPRARLLGVAGAGWTLEEH